MSALGATLHQAIQHVRDRGYGGIAAPVALLVPSDTSGVLALQALSAFGPWIGVHAWTPEGVVRSLAGGGSALTRDDGGAAAVVRAVLAETTPPPPFAFLAAAPWRSALADALERLEGAGTSPTALRSLPDPWTERGALLAWLLDAAAAWRRRQDRHNLATLATAPEDPLAPAARMRGVVVLGDVALHPVVAARIGRWLSERHVAVLRAAPEGPTADLAAHCGRAPVFTVPPAPGALGALQEGRSAPLDDTVGFCRVPDDVREATELVRLALDAARRGTPWDRIAIAIADARQVDAVRDALRDADVPAALLTGPPLIGEPTGRFLRLSLDLLRGDTALATLYAWVSHPLLAHRRRLGVPPTGRGRWRRLLREAGPWSGLARVRTALQAPVADDADLDARNHLVRVVDALSKDLDGMRGLRTLGDHAAGWAQFLRAWCRPVGPDHGAVTELLDGLSLDTAPTTDVDAADEIVRMLAEAPMREGKLTDRAVRVVEPGALRGADVDVVLFGGLVAGRLPRRLPEDPLIPPALAAHLPQPRPLAARGPDEDRRRFADAVSAARVRLCFVVPEATRDPQREAVPSPLVLDALGTLDGRTATWRRWMAGSRRLAEGHNLVPTDAATAISVREHRTALCLHTPPTGTALLESTPEGKRPLDLQRRLAAGDTTPTVPPGLLPLPGDGGAPMTAAQAADFLATPAGFLFREGLRAYRPGRWPAGPLTEERVRNEMIVAAWTEAESKTRDGFARAWAQRVDRLGPPEAGELDERAVATEQALEIVGRMLDKLPTGPTAVAGGGAPWEGLPIAVAGCGGQAEGAGLAELVLAAREPSVPLVLQAAAIGATQVRAVVLKDERDITQGLSDRLADLRADAEAAVRHREEGRWPWSEGDRGMLEEEQPR